MEREKTYTSFAGEQQIASGDLSRVLRDTKQYLETAGDPRVLIPRPGSRVASPRAVMIFEDLSGQLVDFDFSGTESEVLARALPPARERPGPGRPKLGVVSREVSLLPRHWQWLEGEPHGISATLRRLVDEAKKKNPGEQRARQAREAVNKFLTATAGNLEHFEEATRALFAKDNARFAELISDWPRDIRRHALRLLAEAAAPEPDE